MTEAIVRNVISEDDFSFLYGFSIFETFLINKKSKVFLLEKHVERLYNSILFFKLEISYNREELFSFILNQIEAEHLCDCILRVTVSAGNKIKGIKPEFYFTTRENPYTLEKFSIGSKIKVSETKKSESSILLKHKTSNYLENYYILLNAIQDGFDDAILLNSLHFITETTKCNLFFVKENILYTPDLSGGVLPGIIRSFIIDLAKKKHIICQEGFYTVDDLYHSDEIFITNSVIGIRHVAVIEEKIINNGLEGNITKSLKKELNLKLL